MLGSKAPDFDTYGLLRAMHSHNPPPNIRISWDFHPTFMLISGRVQGLSPTCVRAHVGLDLLTLVSYNKRNKSYKINNKWVDGLINNVIY